jgi:hypothetical protein
MIDNFERFLSPTPWHLSLPIVSIVPIIAVVTTVNRVLIFIIAALTHTQYRGSAEWAKVVPLLYPTF